MAEHSLEVLNEREKTHGNFADNAAIAQHLKAYWRTFPSWALMCPEKQEAMDQAASKFARILSGGYWHFDNWRDVAGYCILAEETCAKP